MKREVIKIDKASVFSEAKKQSNYITERSNDEAIYEMARLYREKYEVLEQAFNEGIGIIVNSTRAYDAEVEYDDDDVKINVTVPASHNSSLISSICSEARSVCLYNVLKSWYSIVLPTEAEAQSTLIALHLEIMTSLLDSRTSPKRKVEEDRSPKVEIVY